MRHLNILVKYTDRIRGMAWYIGSFQLAASTDIAGERLSNAKANESRCCFNKWKNRVQHL